MIKNCIDRYTDDILRKCRFDYHIFRILILRALRKLSRGHIDDVRTRRNLKVYNNNDDDVFIVSYPRSGNHWTCFILASLVSGKDVIDFSNVKDIVALPSHMQSVSWMQRPRMISNHEHYDSRYKRVIYIVRDPREVAVSQYYFLKGRENLYSKSYPLGKHIKNFFTGTIGIAGVSWQEHVEGWLGARRSSPDFLLLQYESMLDNPFNSVCRIADFLHISVNDDDIERIVRNTSFANMQHMEQQDYCKRKILRDKNQYLIRNGNSQSWKTVLGSDDIRLIEENWADTMGRLGYEISDQ